MPRSSQALRQLALLGLTLVSCTATAKPGTAAPTRQLRVDFGITESYYHEQPAVVPLYYEYNTPDSATFAEADTPVVPSRKLQQQPAVPAPAMQQPTPTVEDASSLLAVPINKSAASNKLHAAQNVQLRWPPYEYLQQQLKQLDGSAAEGQQQQSPKRFSVVIVNWSRPENTKKIAETYTSDPAYEPYVAEVLVLHLKPEAFFELDNAKVCVVWVQRSCHEIQLCPCY
jgi:hypothetical protein